jgi:predicted alpha/beta hydrolase
MATPPPLGDRHMDVLMRSLLLLGVVSLLTACSITQHVSPVNPTPAAGSKICLIPATGLREGFTQAYGQALQNKGFEVLTLPSTAQPDACPLSSQYIGLWRWDMALYMAMAQITVYQDGKPIGSASYNSQSGGARMDKFINAQEKIEELTDQLFPVGVHPLPSAP